MASFAAGSILIPPEPGYSGSPYSPIPAFLAGLLGGLSEGSLLSSLCAS